ncbi:phenylacetate--CoA ligase [Siccirubricoccus deserti]|uniref:AMP-binding protein n=1 Tax=Siccirubricoccus deserti TaxID=2013562 RepID=A0A9X0R104_9PROT|nr:AMP-binding protein [Siccirubricoccus deserti]MBC4017295.1 AMP-binding protein [Siccirubricoccus deserti]GGC57945.1 phenylacetate--CoA ligase [Siccirubricoccus deserti]
MSEHFDSLETRSAEARAEALAAALPRQVAHARASAPYYAQRLDGLDPAVVTDMAALAHLPVTRKSALIEHQAAEPPFGGVVASPFGSLARVYASPGPLYEPEGEGPDYWRFARALHATGFRAGDLLHNCFAYHFTPAGSMLEGGARALGCPVFPAGTGNTEMQARAAAQLRPRCYSGTPEFLKAILEKGEELGLDLASLRLGHVSGGAYLPSLRAWYAERGMTVLQSYGTADLGLIAYESVAREGLILDEGVVVEIVRPGTGEPLPEGEVGEVVVTTLNPVHPLLRFATGDLSAILPGASPCGRTNARIRGWMGRADQAAKVRGMFVRPEQVAELLRAVPGVARARLVVALDGDRDTMLLRAEAAAPDEALVTRLGLALQAATRLRGTVELVPPGSLPNDGKVIDDTRPVPG